MISIKVQENGDVILTYECHNHINQQVIKRNQVLLICQESQDNAESYLYKMEAIARTATVDRSRNAID